MIQAENRIIVIIAIHLNCTMMMLEVRFFVLIAVLSAMRKNWLLMGRR